MNVVIGICVIWYYAHDSYLEIESLGKGVEPDEGKANLGRHRETAGLALWTVASCIGRYATTIEQIRVNNLE